MEYKISKLKKAVLIVFTVLFIMNLQFNSSLTQNMNGSFSLSQLVENVFFPSVYATGGGGTTWCYDHECPPGWMGRWCSIEPYAVGCVTPYIACDPM